jgi:hypothetical protein
MLRFRPRASTRAFSSRLLPPPTLCDHRALARRFVAVRRRAVFVPRLAYLCGGRLGLNLRAALAAEAGLMPMCQGATA